MCGAPVTLAARQVALYARQELMLRTTSNFLLSLAAFLEPCRPYLRKYFCAAVRLPTDWIEVAELYQVGIAPLSRHAQCTRI